MPCVGFPASSTFDGINACQPCYFHLQARLGGIQVFRVLLIPCRAAPPLAVRSSRSRALAIFTVID